MRLSYLWQNRSRQKIREIVQVSDSLDEQSSGESNKSSKKDRSGARLLRNALFRQLKYFVGALLSGLVWTIAKVSVPIVLELAVNKGIIKGSIAAILKWAGLIAIIGIMEGTAAGIRRYMAFSTAYHIETDLRYRLFAHLQRLHLGYFDKAQAGQLMSRAASDLEQISNLFVNFPITVASVLTVIVTFIIMLIISPLLAILAILPLPIFMVVAKKFTKKVAPLSMELQQELGKMATLVEESVVGIRAVKGFGAQNFTIDKGKKQAGAIYEKAVKFAFNNATYSPILNSIPALSPIIVLLYGGYLVGQKSLSVGALIAFLTYVTMIVGPLTMIGFFVTLIPRGNSAAVRVAEVLNQAPIIVDAHHPKHFPLNTARDEEITMGVPVNFVNVSFAYENDGPVILNDVNFTVNAGETVAIVGKSGSGKSTLVKLIPRFYDVTSGKIMINGLDLRDIKLTELRQQVGFVFEDTFLFSDTVAANISFALPNADLNSIKSAALIANADSFIQELPDGYQTILGEKGLSLSGGQRQRLALARAILSDPKILILDDATSAVDPQNENEILNAIEKVSKMRTTLIIAHRISSIMLADRVAFFDHGKLLVTGTHAELLKTFLPYGDFIGSLV